MFKLKNELLIFQILQLLRNFYADFRLEKMTTYIAKNLKVWSNKFYISSFTEPAKQNACLDSSIFCNSK